MKITRILAYIYHSLIIILALLEIIYVHYKLKQLKKTSINISYSKISRNILYMTATGLFALII